MTKDEYMKKNNFASTLMNVLWLKYTDYAQYGISFFYSQFSKVFYFHIFLFLLVFFRNSFLFLVGYPIKCSLIRKSISKIWRFFLFFTSFSWFCAPNVDSFTFISECLLLHLKSTLVFCFVWNILKNWLQL